MVASSSVYYCCWPRTPRIDGVSHGPIAQYLIVSQETEDVSRLVPLFILCGWSSAPIPFLLPVARCPCTLLLSVCCCPIDGQVAGKICRLISNICQSVIKYCLGRSHFRCRCLHLHSRMRSSLSTLAKTAIITVAIKN